MPRSTHPWRPSLLAVGFAFLEVGFAQTGAQKYVVGSDVQLSFQNGHANRSNKGCVVSKGTKVVGKLVLTLRSEKKEVKAAFAVTGTEPGKTQTLLKTDAGVDWILGDGCWPEPKEKISSKPSDAEINALLLDALSNPTPQKLLLLGQYREYKAPK